MGISNAYCPEVERQLSASEKPISSFSGEGWVQEECTWHWFFSRGSSWRQV